MMNFAPQQHLQVRGLRCTVISVTPTEQELDLVLVVQPDGEVPYDLKLMIQPINGGPQHLVMASELCQLRAELLH